MKTRPSLTLSLLALLTISGGAHFGGLAQAAAIDIATLAECSDRAWEEDIAAWAGYAFERHVTRRSLDKEGETKSVNTMRFRVTPNDDGFDEVLVEIDGRQPKASEVAEHRKAARFTRHYGQAEQLELDNPIGENLALLPILQAQEYRLVGEEEVKGFACHRVAFDARPAPEKADVREQLQYAATGSGCFSVEGCHLVIFEMETARPLKEGAIKLNHLKLSFEGGPVAGGGWLLEKVELNSDAAMLGVGLRKANSYRYTDFRLQPD